MKRRSTTAQDEHGQDTQSTKRRKNSSQATANETADAEGRDGSGGRIPSQEVHGANGAGSLTWRTLKQRTTPSAEPHVLTRAQTQQNGSDSWEKHTFRSQGALVAYAKELARQNGVCLVTTRSEKGVKVTLQCARNGSPRKSLHDSDRARRKERATIKCGCKFRIVGRKTNRGK